jgi:hypothetical protein
MKTALMALIPAAGLVTVAGVFAAGLTEVSTTGTAATKVAAAQQPSYLAAPNPGYIVYTGHAGALPDASCYWTGMPIYDSDRNVIGWRGRPVPVCP